MAVLRRFEVAKVFEVRLETYWKKDIYGGVGQIWSEQ